jgi:hypothetical protein
MGEEENRKYREQRGGTEIGRKKRRISSPPGGTLK